MSGKKKRHPWQCPSCGARAQKCGKGACLGGGEGNCEGLICECAQETAEPHGEVLSDRCPEANCYHCGWGGEMPHVFDTKKLKGWQKKAWEAGWVPPDGWAP